MIPLTVIGGFLGAGKTTLVNHLLRAAPVRYGVLVNDFGAIGIDAALIASRDGDSVALANGCVCCEMGDDLGAGLLRLARRGIEHVVVEASGVGDPWRIAQLALIEPGFSLEPIVVVADAGRVAEHLADRWVADTVAGQLRAAEIVVLNKAEPGRPVAPARDAVAAYRPGVRVVETMFGAIDPEELRFESPTRSRFRADAPADHPFVTWSFVPSEPLDRARLRAALAALPASVLRIKGFCRLGDAAEPYLLQYAAGEWALTPCDGEPGLVAIGTPDMPSRAALAGLLGLVSVRGC